MRGGAAGDVVVGGVVVGGVVVGGVVVGGAADRRSSLLRRSGRNC